MAPWRIYYSDKVVEGITRDDWLAAPGDDVQVIVWRKPSGYRGWRDFGPDVHVWTGDDDYDPFGWGNKTGRLLSDADYAAIWERAHADHRA
jgi:hypothetical protein